MRVVLPLLALSLIAIHGDIDDEPPPAPPEPQQRAPPFTVEELDLRALRCLRPRSERHAAAAGGRRAAARRRRGGRRRRRPRRRRCSPRRRRRLRGAWCGCARPCRAHALDEQFVPTACHVAHRRHAQPHDRGGGGGERRGRARLVRGEVADDKLHGVSSLRWRDGRRYVGLRRRRRRRGRAHAPDEGRTPAASSTAPSRGGGGCRRPTTALVPRRRRRGQGARLGRGDGDRRRCVENDFEAARRATATRWGSATMRGTLKRPGRADALVRDSKRPRASTRRTSTSGEWRRRAQFSRNFLHRVAQFTDSASDACPLTGADMMDWRRLADRVARGLAARDGLVAGVGAADHRARPGQRGAAAGLNAAAVAIRRRRAAAAED